MLQLKFYLAAKTIQSEKYNYGNWALDHYLDQIVVHIPEVLKEGPLADVNAKVTFHLEKLVEKLKLVEANLREYQGSIEMDSNFYL